MHVFKNDYHFTFSFSLVCSDDNTWFESNLALNRRRILDSIQPKTLAEYKQATVNVQTQYRQANQKWPHLSEYDEQYVIPTLVERVHRTE